MEISFKGSRHEMFLLPLVLVGLLHGGYGSFQPAPVGLWMMNSEHIGKDSSGFGNNAKPHNVVLTTGPTGEENTACKFDGSSKSYLEIEGSNSMDVGVDGSFTFTAFVRIETSTAAFLEYSPYGLHVWRWPDTTLFCNAISRGETIFTDLNITTQIWHFIAVSYNMVKGEDRGFLDDKMMTADFKNATIKTNTPKVYIGTRPSFPQGYLNGDMSCAMLFNISLTVSEVNRARKYCLKNANTEDSMFKSFSNGTIPTDHVLSRKVASPLLGCAAACHSEEACVSFSYNDITQDCVLSNVDFLGESVSPTVESGYKIFTLFYPQG